MQKNKENFRSPYFLVRTLVHKSNQLIAYPFNDLESREF